MSGIAVDLDALVRAEELRQLAERTRDAVLRAERVAFQDRWGSFRKCTKCGSRHIASRPTCPWCFGAEYIDCGYAPPP